MDLLDRIGPILGLTAFLGLAILAFLIIMQAREVRRLREWAGRAPERAQEAADASQAAADARDSGSADDREPEPGRLAALRQRAREALAPRWQALDRRSPVDPRLLMAGLAAVAVAAGVVTGGFGLVGDDAGSERAAQRTGGAENGPVEVAVLNATQLTDSGGTPIAGVPGLAREVADAAIPANDFDVVTMADAPEGEPVTVIVYEPGESRAKDQAARLAAAVEPELGEIDLEPMVEAVRQFAEGAPVALLIGQDDAEFAADEPQT